MLGPGEAGPHVLAHADTRLKCPSASSA
jgi:hypothetical protein